MNILVVQTGFFGDVVLTTPVLTNLRQLYPDSHIAVLTTLESKLLLEAHPSVNSVIVFDKRGAHRGIGGLREMAKALREKHFAVAVSLHKSARTSVLLYLSGIPKRIGFAEAALPFLYNKRVSRSHLAHEALRNLVILEGLDVDISGLDSRLSLGISDSAQTQAEALLQEHGLVGKPLAGIAPGSVWATKRWTPSGFAAVADELSALGYQIVILGGPKDADAARAVCALMGAPSINLVGKTDFMVSIALISALEILITNDSAPLHIASACATPVVAAFCATVPEFGFGPWQVNSETVGVPSLSCRPCGRHGGDECPTGTHACQLSLHADQVMNAAKRVLAGSENGRKFVHVQ